MTAQELRFPLAPCIALMTTRGRRCRRHHNPDLSKRLGRLLCTQHGQTFARRGWIMTWTGNRLTLAPSEAP